MSYRAQRCQILVYRIKSYRSEEKSAVALPKADYYPLNSPEYWHKSLPPEISPESRVRRTKKWRVPRILCFKGPFAIRRANALSFIVAMLEALEKSDAY
jgi:hypothetical protein